MTSSMALRSDHGTRSRAGLLYAAGEPIRVPGMHVNEVQNALETAPEGPRNSYNFAQMNFVSRTEKPTLSGFDLQYSLGSKQAGTVTEVSANIRPQLNGTALSPTMIQTLMNKGATPHRIEIEIQSGNMEELRGLIKEIHAGQYLIERGLISYCDYTKSDPSAVFCFTKAPFDPTIDDHLLFDMKADHRFEPESSSFGKPVISWLDAIVESYCAARNIKFNGYGSE